MREKPVSLWSPVQDPLAASKGRADLLARRLARTGAAIQMLRERTERLSWRERGECLNLLQTIEMRAEDAAARLRGLRNESLASGRRWNRLEQSCLEIEEHLGFLAQTIRNRTTSKNRVVTPPPPRRVPS